MDVLVNLKGGGGPVEGDVVQTRRTLREQPVRHGGRVLHADAVAVRRIGPCRLQTAGEAYGERRVGQFGESGDLPYVGGGHDSRNDRSGTPGRRYAVTQPQIVLHMEEHLGDGVIGACPALGHEMPNVALPVE